jgi:hypothetical protein
MRFVAGLIACAVVATTTAAAATRSRLEPAPAVVKGACAWVARAAKQQDTRWRTVCPAAVPRSFSTSVRYAGGVSSTTDLRAGYLIQGFSSDSSSSSLHNGHWTFAAGDPDAVHRLLLGPTARSTTRGMVLAGTPVTIYRVARGTATLSGHVVVEWTRDGQAYQVSVHRWRSDRQGFALATGMAAATIRSLRR